MLNCTRHFLGNESVLGYLLLYVRRMDKATMAPAIVIHKLHGCISDVLRRGQCRLWDKRIVSSVDHYGRHCNLVKIPF
jgi:hypothetical protein